MNKETVLDEIIKLYIKSRDFNGLPVYNMKYYDYNILCELIDEGLIEVLSEKEVINGSIKNFVLLANTLTGNVEQKATRRRNSVQAETSNHKRSYTIRN